MGLIVNMSSAPKKKSVVQLQQDARKFLNNEIYPFLADEIAFTKFKNFLEDEIDKGKKTWQKKYDDEEREYYKFMRK